MQWIVRTPKNISCRLMIFRRLTCLGIQRTNPSKLITATKGIVLMLPTLSGPMMIVLSFRREDWRRVSSSGLQNSNKRLSMSMRRNSKKLQKVKRNKRPMNLKKNRKRKSNKGKKMDSKLKKRKAIRL